MFKKLLVECPFQQCILVETNSDMVYNYLFTKYSQYILREFQPHDHCISDIIIKETGCKYMVKTNDGWCATMHPIYVLDSFIKKHEKYSKNIILLHGSAVEKNGKALVIIAPSMGGKSTLTSFLLENEFNYVSDDCVLIDTCDYSIHPYNTAICLREGGITALEQKGIRLQNLKAFCDIDSNSKRFLFCPNKPVYHSLDINTIYFINRTNYLNSKMKLEYSEALIELFQSTIVNYKFSEKFINDMSHIAKSKCYKITYNDLQFAKDAILNDII